MKLSKKMAIGSVGIATAMALTTSMAFASTGSTATSGSTPTQTSTPGPIGRPGPHGHGPRGLAGPGMMREQLATVAKDLNISTTTLQSDLQAGKTISQIAATKGVSLTTLENDLQTAVKVNLTSLVSAGKITTTQEQAALTNLSQRVADFVTHPMPMGPRDGGPRVMMDAAAKALNVTETTLHADLHAGKTLAEVANAKGVSTAALIASIESSVKYDLSQRVSSGKLTSAEETVLLANLSQRVTDFVNHTMPVPHSGGISTTTKTSNSNASSSSSSTNSNS